MPSTTPEFLTINEVPKMLRVSRETIYRLAARGELPGRKVGRIWRFPRDSPYRFQLYSPSFGKVSS